MKLTEKSNEVFQVVKDNDGKASLATIAECVGRTEKSVGANVTDLQKKGLVIREKVEVEGQDKPVTYVLITDEGKAFVPSED